MSKIYEIIASFLSDVWMRVRIKLAKPKKKPYRWERKREWEAWERKNRAMKNDHR